MYVVSGVDSLHIDVELITFWLQAYLFIVVLGHNCASLSIPTTQVHETCQINANESKQVSDCFRTVKLFPGTKLHVYYTRYLLFTFNKQVWHGKLVYYAKKTVFFIY